MKKSWNMDYPEHTFEIVSPELPSGSAWLVNCLLEIGVPMWQPWEVQISHEWERLSPFKYRYLKPTKLWRQTLPALKAGRVFNFHEKCSGRATHRWASSIAKGKKLILFVRDPRDMLYSQWRRTRYNNSRYEESFNDFLMSKYHHYPINFVEYVRLFLNLWKIEANNFDYLIVKFEDYKKNPIKTLKNVLLFLDVKCTDHEIYKAVDASDFKVVKQVEDELAAKGLLEKKYNYASQAYEYKQHMDECTQMLFGHEFNDLFDWLDYESFSFVQSNPLHIDNHWISVMAKCIYNGTYNDLQRKELERLFTFESNDLVSKECQ